MNRFIRWSSLVVLCFVVSPAVHADDSCYPVLASEDSPLRYFFGNSFSFLEPCQTYACYPSYALSQPPSGVSTSYYTPGYYSRSYSAKIAPPAFSPPQNRNPWPYFYTPAGDYTPGYYSYYYTPGYFRY
jgi:hypothetical protein